MKPTIPMVDAHGHLWYPERLHMSWLDENVLLKRPYLLDISNARTFYRLEGPQS